MKWTTLLALALVGLFGRPAAAQTNLPTVQFEPVFPRLLHDRPVWLEEAPDDSGRLFIVYQDGLIEIVRPGSDGSDAREFFNIVSRNPHFDNECGLLGFAFHPGFRTNHLFYVYYNQKNSEDKCDQPLNFPARSVISEFHVSATNADRADLASERILLQVQQPYLNHKGGELAFGPDGYLYFGLGDGGMGDDPLGNGQSPATLLAKMSRIDVNSRTEVGSSGNRHQLPYGIPSDNPFAHGPYMDGRGALPEIYALGLRNPWRFSFDPQTGALWCGDVGQNLWEEVDLIVNGGNYGWSVREAAHPFKPGPPGAQFIEPIIEYPHHAWQLSQAMYPDHSCGYCVIGGYVYRGHQSPALQGVYLYGDYNFGTIWGLRYDYAAKRVTAHAQLGNSHGYPDSFGIDRAGEIYALMQDGKILHLVAR